MIPDPLKQFLFSTGGGCLIWPNVLQSLSDKYRPNDWDFVKSMNSWDEILDDSQLDIKPRLRTCPPNCLVIGSTEWNWRILIGHSSDNFGVVYAWPYTPFQVWGEDENISLFAIANSLEDFFRGNTADAEQSKSYQSGWLYVLGKSQKVRRFPLSNSAHSA